MAFISWHVLYVIPKYCLEKITSLSPMSTLFWQCIVVDGGSKIVVRWISGSSDWLIDRGSRVGDEVRSMKWTSHLIWDESIEIICIIAPRRVWMTDETVIINSLDCLPCNTRPVSKSGHVREKKKKKKEKKNLFFSCREGEVGRCNFLFAPMSLSLVRSLDPDCVRCLSFLSGHLIKRIKWKLFHVLVSFSNQKTGSSSRGSRGQGDQRQQQPPPPSGLT